MRYILGPRSLLNLRGVHPDLVAVVKRAIEITPVDFTVLEGRRTVERQKQLFAQGASKTMASRHIPTPSKVAVDGETLWAHAVDIAPWVSRRISWHWPHYHELAPAIKQAAEELKIPIEWGGDWTSFVDGPHWQLSRDKY